MAVNLTIAQSDQWREASSSTHLHHQLVTVHSHNLDLVFRMQAQIFERPAAVLRAKLVLRVLDQSIQDELDTIDLCDFDLQTRLPSDALPEKMLNATAKEECAE